MTLKLPARYFTDVPDDVVLFTVEVDRTACLQGGAVPLALEQTFTRLEASGLRLPLSGIVAAAAWQFKTQGQAPSDADRQTTASVLEAWDIKSEKEPATGHNRLLCVPPQNDSYHKTGTELLGVGIGLSVASHLYKIPLNQWENTTRNARFDYTAVYPPTNGRLLVEVRARLDRNNWGEAVRKSAAKLALQTRDFSVADAILCAPRSQPSQRTLRTKDILIMDPVLDNSPLPQSQRLRNIVRHYIPFFERQQGLNDNNFTRRFAARLRELTEADEPTFQNYLHTGDAALRYEPGIGGNKPWRTYVRYDGQRFCGTAMDGYAWPIEIAGRKPVPGQGAYYFALWEPVIEALRDGRIQDLLEMDVTPGTTQHNGRVFVLLEDGIALAWAPSVDQLKPGMFDDLFAVPQKNGSHAPDLVESSTDEAALTAASHAER